MKNNKYSIEPEMVVEEMENTTYQEDTFNNTYNTKDSHKQDDPSSTFDDEHTKRVSNAISIIEKLKCVGWKGIVDASLKLFFIVFIFIILKLMLDPRSTIEYLMDLQEQIQTEQHSELVDQRFKNSPVINQHLKSLRLESGMTRAFIVEFHNGNNNMANLPFYYGDMTYENVEGSEMIQGENNNLSLTRFNFPSVVSQDGYFFGNIDDINKIDPQFAARVKSVGSNYLALLPMYDHNNRAIGILGLSYNKEDYENIDNRKIVVLLGVYSSKIEPLLIPNSKK